MQVSFADVRQFQTFESKEQLNQAIKHFRYEHGHELPEAANRLLDLLASHSLKVLGVSFASIKYLMDKLGISRATLYRHLKKLSELGIIKRKPQFNPQGGQVESLTIIQPFVSERLLAKSKVRRGGETGDMRRGGQAPNPRNTGENLSSNPSDTQSSNSIISDGLDKRNNVNDPFVDDIQLDHTFTPKYIPEEFVQMVKRGFNDARRIKKLWSLVTACFRRYQLPIDAEIAIDAFKQTVLRYKDREIRTSFDRYFWGVLEKMVSAENVRRTVENEGGFLFIGDLIGDTDNAVSEAEERMDEEEPVEEKTVTWGEADPEAEKRIREKLTRMRQRQPEAYKVHSLTQEFQHGYY